MKINKNTKKLTLHKMILKILITLPLYRNILKKYGIKHGKKCQMITKRYNEY